MKEITKIEKNTFIWGETEELFVHSLLVKVIRANDSLSVQVHPTDDVAKLFGREKGKSEFWYVLVADEDAAIYYGFNKQMSEDKIISALENGTICSHINKIPVKVGDGFWVPAGLVHALLKGVKVLEVQNPVDLTYRFYDYGRVDKSGNPRELHIKESLASSNLSATSVPIQPTAVLKDGFYHKKLVCTPLFDLTEVEGKGIYKVNAQKTDLYVYDVLKNAHYSLKKGEELTFEGEVKIIIAEVKECII